MPKFLYKSYSQNILIVVIMLNMTLAIPDKLHKFMKEHKEIRWTEIVRRSLWDYVYKMQRMEKRESERESSESNSIDNKTSKQYNLFE